MDEKKLTLFSAKEKAAEILLRQMEKAEDAFEVFMKDKEQKNRPVYFKDNLLQSLCQISEALSKFRD